MSTLLLRCMILFMASAFSHIAVPVALTIGMGFKRVPWRLLLLGLFLSVAPDLDVIGFKYGIPYDSQWGHRGFSHSFVTAFIVALIFTLLADFFRAKPKTVFTVAFVSMASHAVFDGLTNGGLGVAIFWPFDTRRYFLPWHVIEVSPLGIGNFFTDRGIEILKSEAVYIWAPCLTVAILYWLVRKVKERTQRTS